MTTTPPAHSAESRKRLINRFVLACQALGLVTDVKDETTRVVVNLKDGAPQMAEEIRLDPDEENVLRWWWSWDQPISYATDIARTARLVLEVVGVTVK